MPYRTACILLLFVACVSSSSLAGQAPSPVPSPWVAQDIGSPSPAGSTTFSQGTFTVTASGKDIWSTSDQFHFVYQQVSGDVEVIARVDSIIQTDPWTKAGVMIRGSLAAGAAHGYALVSAGKGLAFQRRVQIGGISTNTTGGAGTAPSWVRLVRAGTTVTAYSSVNGTTWTTIGSDTVALGSTVYVGLAMTSHTAGALATAALSQVSISRLSLPAAETAADIGSPAIAGSTSYRQGTYTVKAAGAGVTGTSDQFHFVYRRVTGDLEIVARVASITNASSLSRAGVMIRETLAPDSRQAFVNLSAGKTYGFRRRVDIGGATTNTSGGSVTAPGWVRLVRTGLQLDAYRSTDGVAWTLIGSDTIPMTNAVYVGLAVTSGTATASTTAVLDSETVTLLTGTLNQPPAVGLTSPASGATYTAPAIIPLAASASDPEGRLARVEFYSGTQRIASDTTSPYSATWSSVPAGTYGLTAVAFDADGGTATSTAMTITVNVAPPPPPPPGGPHFGHVVMVLEENTNYADVVGNSNMPYLNGLANQYALATQYYASTHPSIGNYFNLVTGQILTNNDDYSGTFSVDSIAHQLTAAGQTWKFYGENLPSVGYIGGDSGGYTKHHDPFAYLTDVRNSATQRANLVPFTQFATDLANGTLPDYAFVVPTNAHNMHDGTAAQADSWLKTNINPLLSNSAFMADGLLIVVFDEAGASDSTNGGGRVPLVLVGPAVKKGYASTTQYLEPSVLRLTAEGLGLTTVPGAGASAVTMSEFFTSAP